MSTKNFVSYGDAETIFTKIANAIKGKKDEYETITYAQWLTLSPEQRAAKDYYISDYPASAITAGNVGYDNTESGMAANEVQGAIDELKSDITSKLNFATYTMGSNATVNVYHYSIAVVMSDRGGLYLDGVANRGSQRLVESSAITLTHVDEHNFTLKNNAQYGTTIIVLSDGDITISEVS